MPFPHEHAARQEDPSKYIRFRRKHPKGFPVGVDVVYGITRAGKVEVQTIRFDSDKWKVSEAKKWLKDHDFKTGIEPAKPEARMSGVRMFVRHDHLRAPSPEVTRGESGAVGPLVEPRSGSESRPAMEASMRGEDEAEAGDPKTPLEVKGARGSIHLYDVIGGWDGITAKGVLEALADLKAGGAKALDVHVHSPGGDVFEGVAIHQAIRAWDGGGDRTVHVDGLCASIASVIAMAGDTIKMAPHAMIMIHEPKGVAMGNAEELHKSANRLEAMSAVMAGVYAKRTGLDEAECLNMISKETWMTAADAKAKGFADEIVGEDEAEAEDEPEAKEPVEPVEPDEEDPEEEEEDEDEAEAKFKAVAGALYRGAPPAAEKLFRMRCSAAPVARARVAKPAPVSMVTVVVPAPAQTVPEGEWARIFSQAEVSDTGSLLAKVAGWKAKAQLADELTAQAAVAVEEKRAAEIVSKLDAAQKDGRLSPANRAKLVAKDAPPFAKDPAQLSIYLSMLTPAVVTVASGGTKPVAKEPPPGSEVSESESDYARQMGLDLAAVAIFKVEGPEGLARYMANKK
jgi:ATP-dependent Clp protease protease subunit